MIDTYFLISEYKYFDNKITSAFLNTAIGQLYGKYSEEQIKAGLLPPGDMDKDDLLLLKRVVERAKEYFKDAQRYDKDRQEILEDDDNE